MGQKIHGKAIGDHLGYSVSLAKDAPVLAVGGNQAGNGGTGTTRVFKWNGSAWQQDGSALFGEASDDLFGSATCLSAEGSGLVVAAWNNDANELVDAGQMRVYASL